MGFAWIPIEETEYKQNEYPFYKNVKMNTGGDALTFQDVFNVSNAIDVTLRSGYSKDFCSDGCKECKIPKYRSRADYF